MMHKTRHPKFDIDWLYVKSEPFVFQFAIQKVKDQDIQNYNIARCSVWVWNLVANIEGGTQTEGV